MRYRGTYYTPYAGTDVELFFISDSEEDVELYMSEGLNDYAQNYEYLVHWDEEDGEDFYDSQDYDNYITDCGFSVEETTEEDAVKRWGNRVNWIDLRIN